MRDTGGTSGAVQGRAPELILGDLHLPMSAVVFRGGGC